jgi:hypothetical protein
MLVLIHKDIGVFAQSCVCEAKALRVEIKPQCYYCTLFINKKSTDGLVILQEV